MGVCDGRFGFCVQCGGFGSKYHSGFISGDFALLDAAIGLVVEIILIVGSYDEAGVAGCVVGESVDFSVLTFDGDIIGVLLWHKCDYAKSPDDDDGRKHNDDFADDD